MSFFDIILVQPLFNILAWLYAVIPGGDFGISIIVFTVFIRIALYPLIKKQLHQSRAMKKIQPELAAIKKKAKGDRQQQGLLMLELYKQNNIKPFSSLLPLIIQIPIFIALFRVIRILTEHRDQVSEYAYSFIEHLEPIKQLINHPESFNATLFNIVDLTQPAFSQHGIDFILVILALLSAGSQFIISRQISPTNENRKRLRDIFAEAANGKEPDQAEMTQAMMNRMMTIFPIFMFFIMVSVPGGLALYYGSSNMVAMLQQHIILKRSEDELESLADKADRKAKRRAAKANKGKIVSATTTKVQPKKPTTKKPATKKTESKPVAKTPTVTRISAKDNGKRSK